MGLILLVALLVILFGGLGFAAPVLHFLWVVAVIMALVWLIGFFVRGSEARWYRW